MSMFDGCLYFNLATLNRKITKVWDAEFGELGLAPSQGYILTAMVKRPEISHKELGELMELDPSTITRFLDKLEKKGLVVKTNKGKGAKYRITGKGEALGLKIDRLMKRLFRRMQAHFGEAVFSSLVGRLHETRRSLK